MTFTRLAFQADNGVIDEVQMKEAIAMWKQRLVHFDLFIICF